MSEAKIVLSAVDNTGRAFASARQGLSGLGSAAASVKAALTGIGAVAAASYLTSIVGETKRAIDGFKDLSDATGSSVENISALDRVARTTGGNFEQVSGILLKFNQALLEADPKKGAGAVLASLNLDIAELKRLDPAEALRRTAVALDEYADDGEKARAVQVLFGKSVREAAPFLKDLAESGKLVGTVSKEAEVEVDRFNKQLALIKANATDVERALTVDIITSLNELIERYKVGQREGKAFWEIAWQGYKQDVRSFWGMGQEDPIADIRREIVGVEKELGALRARKGSPFNFAGNLDAEIAEAEKKLADAQKRLYSSGLGSGRSAGGGRGFINPEVVKPQLKVVEEKDPKKKKEAADFVGLTYDEQITQSVGRLFEDSDITKAQVYADTLKKLDELYYSGAIGADLYDAAMKRLNGSTSAGADQTSKFSQEQQRLNELLTDSELESQRADMELLTKALKEGAITERVYADAVSRRLGLYKGAGQDDAISSNLAASIEDGILNGFRDGKSAADIFLDELKAQFGKAVLRPVIEPIVAGGMSGVGGFISKMLMFDRGSVNLGTATGADLAIAFDGGGYTGNGSRSGGLDGKGGFMAMLHPQETVIDHTKGQRAPTQSVTIVINNTIGSVASQADVVAGMQAVEARMYAALSRSSRYGGDAG